ncbi:hypothetical protein BDFG_03275 [Blastomyces dermatitidis ATCC 26199]|nr:hypothetical protein BDFG_03275 [Blastomyces dermatitidis ATCC 26199]
MKQHGSRYGFVLTDHELVAVRRLDGNGNLELSAPIYPGRITGRQLNHVSRLCWLYGYLGMLAAKDVGQDRWNLP